MTVLLILYGKVSSFIFWLKLCIDLLQHESNKNIPQIPKNNKEIFACTSARGAKFDLRSKIFLICNSSRRKSNFTFLLFLSRQIFILLIAFAVR